MLSRLCTEYMGLLKLSHAAFLESIDFDQLLDTVMPLDKDVAKRVDERDVVEIAERVMGVSPTAEIRQKMASGAAPPTGRLSPPRQYR